MSWALRLHSAGRGAQRSSGDGPVAAPTFLVPGWGRGGVCPGESGLGKAGLMSPDISEELGLKVLILLPTFLFHR